MTRLSRRQFVVGTGAASLGLLAGCGRWPGQAEPPAPKVLRIGFLVPGAPSSNAWRQDAFRQGLQDLVQDQATSLGMMR